MGRDAGFSRLRRRDEPHRDDFDSRHRTGPQRDRHIHEKSAAVCEQNIGRVLGAGGRFFDSLRLVGNTSDAGQFRQQLVRGHIAAVPDQHHQLAGRHRRSSRCRGCGVHPVGGGAEGSVADAGSKCGVSLAGAVDRSLGVGRDLELRLGAFRASHLAVRHRPAFQSRRLVQRAGPLGRAV